uniref:UDP-glycosyltransferase TURAN n=1 Tax=Zea mays TaxID=4577 RepID=A0A804Q9Q1_MAIZE
MLRAAWHDFWRPGRSVAWPRNSGERGDESRVRERVSLHEMRARHGWGGTTRTSIDERRALEGQIVRKCLARTNQQFKYEKGNKPLAHIFRMPDEDFSIVLEAVLMYDRRVAAALGEDDSTDEEQLWIDIKNGKQFVYPRLLFIVTGKGPDRKKYEDQIKRLKLRRVALRTMWLASEDYPLLLGMPADFTSVCTLVAQNLPNLMGTRA